MDTIYRVISDVDGLVTRGSDAAGMETRRLAAERERRSAFQDSEPVDIAFGVATRATYRRGKSVDCAPEIRSVTRSDKGRYEAAMTMAFSADPAARWAWPDPRQFLDIFVPLVTLFGGKSFDHGSAYVIGDFIGVAQWLPPGVQPDDGPIGELFEQNMSGPKLGEVLYLFEQMAGFHPHEPHWYIPLFGVDPVFQGRGYGTQLMRRGLIACDRDEKPVYLEATSPTNRAFYERHGFRVLGEIRSGDSPPLFPMLREPQRSGSGLTLAAGD